MTARLVFLLAIAVQLCDVLAANTRNEDSMHPLPARRDKRSTRFTDSENTAAHWVNNAQSTLASRVSQTQNTNVAKNVILFLGDGMSVPTLAAARAYIGQQQNETGEESSLSFDLFPYSGLSKTYCVDYQVPDSACTATAYLCGVKANEGTIGVTGDVALRNCDASTNTSNHVYSIARWSQLAGKRTGLVTTTRVTHASPAGVYSHTADRDWESDTDVISDDVDPELCRDIAYQLVYGETGQNLNVILGGGRRKFLPNNVTEQEGKKGQRTDYLNLIEAWLEQKEERNQSAEYVYDRDGLLNVKNDTDYLMGLFAASHCEYNLDANATRDPTLVEMTEAAIKILSKSENGFFLFVEGGRIDHAHHDTLAKKSLDETSVFSQAIQRARNLTSTEDTLIVVTSDHSHTLTFSGYPERGNDILGIAGYGSDGLPYATLSYANGPGYRSEADGIRPDISEEDMHDNEYKFPAMVPLSSETHGGDDVGVFASGPWAHLLSGVIEQNVIPHVMAYASCVGEGLTACSSATDETETDSSSIISINWLTILTGVLVLAFCNSHVLRS